MARPKQGRPEPQLREYRLRAHLTQEEVAATIGANAELVRKHERGLARPTEHYRKRYCELYKADEVQLGLRAPERVSAEAEEVVDVLARIRRLETSRIGADMLLGLGLAVEDIIDRYERVGPALVGRCANARHWMGSSTTAAVARSGNSCSAWRARPQRSSGTSP